MKRKIYNKIKSWKEKWGGNTALMIDGARRVGKSWIAEEFARNEYSSYILIDFNNVAEKILELFEHYLTDLDEFFSRLSLYTEVELFPRKSVIVFDEVQLYPKARAALKYLVKDGRYDYIETGSLVSINHNVKDIVIPSEEMRIEMYAMDFEEYLWAIGKGDIYELVRKCFENKKSLGQSVHRSMMELIRSYILVGGMPQAVESYVATKDYTIVDGIKRSILALYRNDVSKYAGKQAARVTTIYDNIPGLLQQHEKRIRPSMLKKGGRMRDFSEALFWLNESRIINPCYAATEPSVSLSLNKDDSKVKLYMADTGLLISMAFEREQLVKEVYETDMNGFRQRE
ncbi:MAG: ATP-binding protein [Muribaculum sp.]|nr:ATP-binding protein [Muribaculum sp.]